MLFALYRDLLLSCESSNTHTQQLGNRKTCWIEMQYVRGIYTVCIIRNRLVLMRVGVSSDTQYVLRVICESKGRAQLQYDHLTPHLFETNRQPGTDDS